VGTEGAGPSAPAFDPAGRFLYTVNYRSGISSAFSINATTGSLTHIAGSPFQTPIRSANIMMRPDGRFAYINSDGEGLCHYEVDANTGALNLVPSTPSPDERCANIFNSEFMDAAGRFSFDRGGAAVPLDPVTGRVGTRSAIGGPLPVGFQMQFVLLQ
jgi:hypothetical protein